MDSLHQRKALVQATLGARRCLRPPVVRQRFRLPEGQVSRAPVRPGYCQLRGRCNRGRPDVWTSEDGNGVVEDRNSSTLPSAPATVPTGANKLAVDRSKTTLAHPLPAGTEIGASVHAISVGGPATGKLTKSRRSTTASGPKLFTFIAMDVIPAPMKSPVHWEKFRAESLLPGPSHHSRSTAETHRQRLLGRQKGHSPVVQDESGPR